MHLNSYIANFRIGFLQVIIYRNALLFYLLSKFIIFYGFYYLWKAVFISTENGILVGMTFEDFFSYLLAAQLVTRFITGPAWGYFSENIRTGAVLYDLVQPVKLEWIFFIRQLSRKTLELSITSFVFVLVVLTLRIAIFDEFQFGWFFLSLVMGFTCSYFFEMLISISAFYTISLQGINEVKILLVSLLSGSLFPIDLFPDALIKIIQFLPFKYFVYTPVVILLGNIQGWNIIKTLIIQLIWILILSVITSYAMYRTRQYFNVHGG